MNSFKTPKGTELPLLMIERKKKNKQTGQYEPQPPQPYLQVAHRLVWMREELPKGKILTEIIVSTQEYSIVKATIYDENDRILATAHKREDRSDWNDHLEKCETGAIGRALALCSYGTQFAPELDEQDRLADAPIEPAKKPPLPYNRIKPQSNAPDDGPIPPIEWENTGEDLPVWNVPDQSVDDQSLGNIEFKDGKYKGLTFAGFVKKDLQGAAGYAKYLEKLIKDGKHLTSEKKSFITYAKNAGLFNIEIKGNNQ